ncbi:MAG: hypothetical protein CMB64_05250 [Euryarchaeota archaeon]|nr:hypothetical protein [Euryarchaeota archaeon]
MDEYAHLFDVESEDDVLHQEVQREEMDEFVLIAIESAPDTPTKRRRRSNKEICSDRVYSKMKKERYQEIREWFAKKTRKLKYNPKDISSRQSVNAVGNIRTTNQIKTKNTKPFQKKQNRKSLGRSDRLQEVDPTYLFPIATRFMTDKEWSEINKTGKIAQDFKNKNTFLENQTRNYFSASSSSVYSVDISENELEDLNFDYTKCDIKIKIKENALIRLYRPRRCGKQILKFPLDIFKLWMVSGACTNYVLDKILDLTEDTWDVTEIDQEEIYRSFSAAIINIDKAEKEELNVSSTSKRKIPSDERLLSLFKSSSYLFKNSLFNKCQFSHELCSLCLNLFDENGYQIYHDNCTKKCQTKTEEEERDILFGVHSEQSFRIGVVGMFIRAHLFDLKCQIDIKGLRKFIKDEVEKIKEQTKNTLNKIKETEPGTPERLKVYQNSQILLMDEEFFVNDCMSSKDISIAHEIFCEKTDDIVDEDDASFIFDLVVKCEKKGKRYFYDYLGSIGGVDCFTLPRKRQNNQLATDPLLHLSEQNKKIYLNTKEWFVESLHSNFYTKFEMKKLQFCLKKKYEENYRMYPHIRVVYNPKIIYLDCIHLSSEGYVLNSNKEKRHIKYDSETLYFNVYFPWYCFDMQKFDLMEHEHLFVGAEFDRFTPETELKSTQELYSSWENTYNYYEGFEAFTQPLNKPLSLQDCRWEECSLWDDSQVCKTEKIYYHPYNYDDLSLHSFGARLVNCSVSTIGPSLPCQNILKTYNSFLVRSRNSVIFEDRLITERPPKDKYCAMSREETPGYTISIKDGSIFPLYFK